MLFMIIETFRDGDAIPAYRHFRTRGRVLPEGVEYVDSWIEVVFGRCFQIMRCDDGAKLQQWVLEWHGVGVTFEIVPIVPSAETRAVVAPYLDAAG
jgi:hypothetical protein